MQIVYADYCLCSQKEIRHVSSIPEYFKSEHQAIARFQAIQQKLIEEEFQGNLYYAVHLNRKHILTIKEKQNETGKI